MIVKTKILWHAQRGASVTDVLLAMAIVMGAAPLLWHQVSDVTADIADMQRAREIIAGRDGVLNFVRLNQDTWPDQAQIRLDADELKSLSDGAVAGFVDKYTVRGAARTDVYMAFDLDATDVRTARVADHIGTDAAVVGDDGVAYGASWAVSAPDFQTGHLIYRISYDFAGEDKTKYLHRTVTGDENLNVMARDLHLGHNNLYDVGTVSAASAKIQDVAATFVTAETLSAGNVFFVSGANLDGNAATFGGLRVTGDMTGFRTMTTEFLNGSKFTTLGRVITDRASVTGAVHVARDLNLKTDTTRTISGFVGISANAVKTPFLSAQEMIFYENFGLTVSGELLVSTNVPLKIGGWSFPSLTPPRFATLEIARGTIPAAPGRDEFGVLMGAGWQDAPAMDSGGVL
ncbi:hypothetical protein HDR63_01670 [bacterium]|nr:hypothetical protein [bacterium]